MRYAWIIIHLIIALPCISGSVLDQYVKEGLQNNLALRQKTFSYRQSIAALYEARGMFMPSISVEARYTRSGGGREIEFPVGTLMNPVYATLNQMLTAIGEAPRFPENLPDQYIPFLRDKEHETKLRLIQPLFQPAISDNYKIHKGLKKISAREVDLTARALAAEIKTAYFNYLKTLEIKKLLDQTFLLLQENVRVNQSLFENNKAAEASVFRARAELVDLKQKQAEAERNSNLAAAFFNFLLNRPLDASIIAAETETIFDNDPPGLADAESNALVLREELNQLSTAVLIAEHKTGLSKRAFLPGITLVADYGFQGEEYSFTSKDDYWTASVVFSWNIFSGFRNQQKVRQAKLEKNRLQTSLAEAQNNIRLEVRQAWENLKAARQAIETAAELEKFAREAYRMTDRLYREGMAAQIEYLDALTVLTRAQTQGVVNRYNYHIQKAFLEKATAQYTLPEWIRETERD